MNGNRGGNGTITFIACRIGSFGLAAGSSIIIGRRLGPSDFGIFASAAAVVAVVLLLGYFGLDQLYLRDVIDLRELRARSAQAAILAGLLTATAAAAWPGIGLPTRLCVALLGVVAVCDQMRLSYVIEPLARLDFVRRGVRELKLRAAVVGAGLAAAALRPQAIPVAIGTALGAVATLPLSRQTDRTRFPSTWSGTKATFRAGIPYALSAALYTAYFQVDMALLASLRPAREVGLYRAAYSLVAAAVVLPVILHNDILRTRLYTMTSAAQDSRTLVRRFGVIALLSGLVVTAGFQLIGPTVIRLGFGREYEEAVVLVRILGLAMAPHFLNSWAGNTLVARGRLRTVIKIQAALLAVNLLGNLALIPTFGARGAAAMTAGTEAGGLALYLLVLRRHRRPRASATPRHDDEPLPEPT